VSIGFKPGQLWGVNVTAAAKCSQRHEVCGTLGVEHNEGDRCEGFSEAEERTEEAGAEDVEGTPLGEEGRSEDPRNRGVTHTRMRGELRFFNEETQRGLIRTSEEDYTVLGSGFVDGHPVGRCAGVAVDFEVEGVDSESLAVRVSIVDVTPGRRARRHSRG
jgi:hypothetical protein